jgi:hypothetical protein
MDSYPILKTIVPSDGANAELGSFVGVSLFDDPIDRVCGYRWRLWVLEIKSMLFISRCASFRQVSHS